MSKQGKVTKVTAPSKSRKPHLPAFIGNSAVALLKLTEALEQGQVPSLPLTVTGELHLGTDDDPALNQERLPATIVLTFLQVADSKVAYVNLRVEDVQAPVPVGDYLLPGDEYKGRLVLANELVTVTWDPRERNDIIKLA